MTFIDEVVISGFIGKVVSDCIDISWSKIKEADKNRKSKNQNLQTRIYQVIVDAINELTYNKYNGQDALYDVAENLLNGLKSGNNNRIEVVKHGLSTLISDADNDKDVEFLGILRTEISKECNFDLYKEILIMLLEQTTEYNYTELQQIKEQLNYIIQKLDENAKIQEDNTHYKVKSRTQEYADKWDSNMFLNDFDKRDKHAGVNVKLKDVYLESHLPHYIWKDNPEDEPSTDLKVLLSEYIDDNSGNKMLLILGQPGIGKSTLITWITANFTSRVDDIMIYQFATDLKDIDWQSYNISSKILDALNLSYNDLNGKILILDGFDEISVGDRKEILDKIYWKLIKGRNVERFSLIITCRENYINSFERIQCKYITLLPWDEMQIKSFCTIFQEKTNGVISEHTMTRVIANKDIFGIPLILYMILALNISIEKEGSIVDIYDKIFSLEGGVYDRCIENKNFADKHRIGEIKQQIHQISREIAIWIFEHNPVGAYIPQKEYEIICDSVMKKQERNDQVIKRDILIGNYFRLVRHSEGGAEGLYFVHRSIYEYFVAETIYSSIKDILLELSEEGKKELAGKIAVYLKKGLITSTIGEYLQYMILKLYQSLNSEKKERFYVWWESTVDMMVSHGMFYYTEKNIQFYEKIIDKEVNCFANLLKILRSLFVVSNQSCILENIKSNQLEKYIILRLMNCKWEFFYGTERFNLSKVFLSERDFEGLDLTFAYLEHACLKNAVLCNVDLRNVVLYGADLNGADLSGADLRGANLRDTDLRNADLKDADLRDTDLRNANLERADLEGAKVYSAYWAGANIEKTIWHDSDIYNVFSQLEKTHFNTLQIRDDDRIKVVCRRELFPDDTSSSNV